MASQRADPDTIATLLEQNAAAVVRALRHGADASALGALSAALTLGDVVDDATRCLVAAARSEKSTWAEIGAVLRTSRQAAHQRFSREEAVARREFGTEGLEVVRRWSAGEMGALVAKFDPALGQRLDAAGLAAAWQLVERRSGRLRTMGRPTVARRGGYRVVDIPLAFEAGPMKARVTFDATGRISGLFLLNPGVL